ncbi:MAG: hypothetical protein QW478_08825 [Candidatus Micrarchaeaceae archaeon]
MTEAETDAVITNNKTKEQLSLFAIKNALAVGISVMVSEHFFSTYLSSPLTVETLYKDSGQKVMNYFWEAAGSSIVFGLIMDFLLKDKYFLGTVSAVGTTLLYYVVYRNALKQTF